MHGSIRNSAALLVAGFLLAALESAAPQPLRAAPLPPPPGRFRISYPSLGAWGEPLGPEVLAVPLPPLGISTATLSRARFEHHGITVPVLGGTASEAWLLAPRRHTPYDRHDALFATPAAAIPSDTVVRRPAWRSLPPVRAEIPCCRRRLYDYHLRFERGAPLPAAERFVWWQLRSNDPARREGRFDLPFPDRLTSDTLRVELDVVGLTTNPAADPDHFADFFLAGAALPRLVWEGSTLLRTTHTLVLPAIPATNSLTLVHRVPDDSPLGGGVDYQNLESIALEWTGLPRLDAAGACRIDFPANPAGRPRPVTIGGFPPGTLLGDFLLLDVTQPTAPEVLTSPTLFADASGGCAIGFEAWGDACAYAVFRLAQIASPSAVVPAEALPPVPGAVPLRGIHVRPPEFADILAPLGTLRGPGIVVLDPQAAWNAYSGGQESPEGLRRTFQAYLEACPDHVPLPSILLAGYGSLDPRSYLPVTQTGPIPPFVEENEYLYPELQRANMPTDYPYTLLAGSDDVPDACIGRIPARTPAELQTAVERAITHQARVPELRRLSRPGVFVTGSDPAFLDDAPGLRRSWASTGRPAVAIDVLDPIVDGLRVRNAFQAPPGGAALVFYVGHGNAAQWTSKIVDVPGVDLLDTRDRWPVVVAATCMNGYYAYPGDPRCLSEAWLFTSGSGAPANIAPAGIEDYFLVRLFMAELVGTFEDGPAAQPRTAGELLARAQARMAAREPQHRSLVRMYHLFGDPDTDLTLTPLGTGTANWTAYP